MTERSRLLAVTLALGVLLTPLAAETQPAGRLPRVGFLGNMAPPPPPVSQLDGFLEGLSELGYVEGRNILIEYRWAEGKLERLPALAAELARLNLAVMVVAGQQGFDAGRNAAPGVPLVMLACDPLETILGSLARPGANATGVTCVSAELATKRLELLKEVVPKLARVAVLYNPGDPNKAVEVRQSTDGGGAGRVFDECDLAEGLALLEDTKGDLLADEVAGDHTRFAVGDEVRGVATLAFRDDPLPGGEPLEAHRGGHADQLDLRQGAEHG